MLWLTERRQEEWGSWWFSGTWDNSGHISFVVGFFWCNNTHTLFHLSQVESLLNHRNS